MHTHLLVRASDPISSILAAERTPTFAGKHRERIANALLYAWQATPHELVHLTGLTVVQIDRRLPELRAAGRARVVQVDGEDLMRGRARVWEAV